MSKTQLELLFKAALRAADHGWLHPTRFITVQGKAREQLGKIFFRKQRRLAKFVTREAKQAAACPFASPFAYRRDQSAKEHPKIPKLEQLLSSAASAQNILNAAAALGLGAIWRTGDVAHNPNVARPWVWRKTSKLSAFVYVGEAQGEAKPLPELNLSDFVQELALKQRLSRGWRLT